MNDTARAQKASRHTRSRLHNYTTARFYPVTDAQEPFTAEDAEHADAERVQPVIQLCGLCALRGEKLLDSENA